MKRRPKTGPLVTALPKVKEAKKKGYIYWWFGEIVLTDKGRAYLETLDNNLQRELLFDWWVTEPRLQPELNQEVMVPSKRKWWRREVW